ncbi:MAG: HAMP domain-containing sensor histidine kinase [Campylobacterota bacterium]|nr:HAMP domain-containing sensor histidine kinase [Campylobacterota bacterium]
MKLQIDEEKFALKYALIYTSLVFLILLFPFFIYTKHIFTLEESKTNIDLKKKSIQIINQMENFAQTSNKIFVFPRYKQYQAGLYDANSNKIFTTIDKDIGIINKGYKKIQEKRLFVVRFNSSRYFDAKYLVVVTTFDNTSILQNIFIIFTLIIMVTLLLSLFILKHFAKPFKQVHNTLDQFIKDSMHEINTPLSIINISIDMFSREFGKNKYLNRVKSASKILSSIYNDMNYLIKEQTINKTPKEYVDLSGFLKKSVDYFQDIANIKDITIHSDIEKNVYIEFVPTKIQKIVDNNLSNAIKYSNEGKNVYISLKQSDDEIVLQFKDEGIGIENTSKIFSRYYREDHTKGGFGIGLNIVGQIVRDENIIVKLDSIPGEGSCFSYSFKLK